MKRTKRVILGMSVEIWTHKSCEGTFAVGEDWATLYYIASREKGKGHATELLREAKAFYEGEGKRFGGSVALNACTRSIYKKLNIKEYT